MLKFLLKPQIANSCLGQIISNLLSSIAIGKVNSREKNQ